MLWLLKTFVLSAGMYASHIWYTQFLEHDNVFIRHVPVVKKRFYVAREPMLALNPSLRAPTPHISMRTAIQGFELQTKGSLLILNCLEQGGGGLIC
jgi:hypothetical protein